MTNDEMLYRVKAGIGKPMSISMSKAGTFLTIGEESLGEISMEQACIMWDLMPMLAGAIAKPGILSDHQSAAAQHAAGHGPQHLPIHEPGAPEGIPCRLASAPPGAPLGGADAVGLEGEP